MKAKNTWGMVVVHISKYKAFWYNGPPRAIKFVSHLRYLIGQAFLCFYLKTNTLHKQKVKSLCSDEIIPYLQIPFHRDYSEIYNT